MRFVEFCCGSAAVSYSLFGAYRLAPYMGSKMTYAKQLVELMQLNGELKKEVRMLREELLELARARR